MELTNNKPINLESATTAAGNNPTINEISGVITTAALTTVAYASTSVTLTNSYIIDTNTHVYASIEYAGTGGAIVLNKVTVTAGQCVFNIFNAIATTPLNAAATIKFFVVQKTTN
jgi:hypothetical protein